MRTATATLACGAALLVVGLALLLSASRLVDGLLLPKSSIGLLAATVGSFFTSFGSYALGAQIARRAQNAVADR